MQLVVPWKYKQSPQPFRVLEALLPPTAVIIQDNMVGTRNVCEIL